MTASTPELQRCLDAYHMYRLQAVALSVAALLMMVAMQQLPAESFLLVGRKVGYHDLFTVLLATLFLAGALAWAGYTFHRLRQRSYANTLDRLNNALQNQQLSAVQNTIATVREQAKRQPLIAEALQSLQLPLNQHLDNLTRRQLHSELAAECAKANRQCDQHLKNIKTRIPLVMAENSVRNTLSGLQQRREQLHRQWQQAYRNHTPVGELLGIVHVPLFSAIGLLRDMQVDTCAGLLECLKLLFSIKAAIAPARKPQKYNQFPKTPTATPAVTTLTPPPASAPVAVVAVTKAAPVLNIIPANTTDT